MNHLTIYPRILSGASAGHPTDDMKAAAMVGMFTKNTGSTSNSHFPWTQARIGDAWYDLPADLRVASAAAGTDITAAAKKRNHDVSAGGTVSFVSIFKHFPFGTIRAPWNDDGTAATGNGVLRQVAEGKE